MTSLFTAKTNFTAGELSHDLLGRVDLSAYANGAMELKNVFIEPTGGVHRRPGLKYVDTLQQTGRLVNFELSALENYLIVLHAGTADIYKDGVFQTEIETPYTAEQLKTIHWSQSADALFLTHQDVCPQKIEKKDGIWTISDFEFLVEDECILQPYHKFCSADTTISSSGITGTVTLKTSKDFFTTAHVGTQIKIADGYVVINSITNAKTAAATVKKKLVSDADDGVSLEATRSFWEPVFTEERGWPVCVAFYQSRLIFGGSKKLPNTLWFSQTSDLTNFELGDGYDAEGISFSILSDQSNIICALFAGRHLQVFTTSAEWMVSGDPLTPTNIQLKRQTQVGSPARWYVPPIGIDGATIFPSANGREIREFLFADIEQAYQATDLSLLASHLINDPQDQAYDKHNRQAYILMSNGHVCVLCSFRSEDIQSWTELTTQGDFISVCMSGQKAYFITKREETYYLECFDDDIGTDLSCLLTAETPTDTFEVPEYLKGKTVKIVADDIVLPDQEVTDGQIILPFNASKVEVGLGFEHIISPLPPSVGATNSVAPVSACRLVKACFRVINTNTLEIDTGNGIRQEVSYPLDSYKFDSLIQKQTSDIVVRALGWVRAPDKPLWRIIGETPKPFKLVSVTQDLKIGG